MADFTIGVDSNPYHGLTNGGVVAPEIQYWQETTCASTKVIKRGDIVSQDTLVSTLTYRIVRAPAGGGNGSNLLLTNAIMGVAVENSTSDGSTTGLGNVNNRLIGLIPARQNTEFVGYLSAGASDPSLVGTQKAIRYDSTNHVFMVDSTNSTAALAAVTITGLVRGTEGDTNAPVYFRFLSSNLSAIVSGV